MYTSRNTISIYCYMICLLLPSHKNIAAQKGLFEFKDAFLKGIGDRGLFNQNEVQKEDHRHIWWHMNWARKCSNDLEALGNLIKLVQMKNSCHKVLKLQFFVEELDNEARSRQSLFDQVWRATITVFVVVLRCITEVYLIYNGWLM